MTSALKSQTPHLFIPSTPSPLQKSNSDLALNKLKNDAGYRDTVYKDKDAQCQLVIDNLKQKGFIPSNLVDNEVNWFYTSLGIDDTYFKLETVDTISDHIISLYAAKLVAYTKHRPDKSLDIDLQKERENDAIFIHSPKSGSNVEEIIDSKYFNSKDAHWRMETYRSSHLRCYFLAKCKLPETISTNGDVNIRTVADPLFLEKASNNTLDIYQRILNQVDVRAGPVVEGFEIEGSTEHRIVIGYKRGTTKAFFSTLTNLYHFYGLYSTRKFVEHFSNGSVIVSLYLNKDPLTPAPPISHSVVQIVREVSLIYCLPDNPFFSRAAESEPGKGNAVQEATYAYIGYIYITHFCNRLGTAYEALKSILDESNPNHAGVLADLKKRFREETFTKTAILEVIKTYPELVRLLYTQFAMSHYPAGGDDAEQLVPTLSHQRLQEVNVFSDEELHNKLVKSTRNQFELQVLESFMVFNKHVLKTNFYQPTKVALSFRLDGDFLPIQEYPQKPYGVFFVVGSDFQGFHVRFKDVARGGIRILRSRDAENYATNQRMLFDECFNLASTQSLKNKDIPEGGSKGVILPDLNANPQLSFERYVDSIIDLLIPGSSPGIKEPIVDLLGKQEILFLGPDEGTAGFMDWAAFHARSRGAEWWKSFTTGKTAESLGGIPHDTYGMTSRSVRQYYVGILDKLAMDEENTTKVQTGGPDGDLGSNEILLSKDKTVAIVDGSGVIYDPVGLNRDELTRLATARVMINQFDLKKLSKDGYRVLCEDKDIRLPSGEMVADGTQFRNGYHLRVKAEVLIPCGGRPQAINISNVNQLFDAEGKPHFKIIVEGANLFVTQQARLVLEKRGVILIRDSSANKGGVTSSSLEVLAGLALNEDEYVNLMMYKDGKPSEFYNNYVKDIQDIIASNATLEFNCIWKEHQRLNGQESRTIISDKLSSTLNKLQLELESSDSLFRDIERRKKVLAKAMPKTLVEYVGIDTLIERLPESYQKALFACQISRFCYTYGPAASQVEFYLYMSQF
ncbi:NAD-dependent glutamate dehydrogenase [Wallemia mellicola]|uniref:NAD-specific glutamate dehydrogenase n=1 Tax=Wallemia mellicola TaxID=1708541 RepID=A0A4T0PXR3_9BASI|nr:NAD-dependent glutamate dehydrogenase [Wallemia mellicola]TIC16010.1 NAD-dependent glutamate dehydrogenase [Wallemia mellicola]